MAAAHKAQRKICIRIQTINLHKIRRAFSIGGRRLGAVTKNTATIKMKLEFVPNVNQGNQS